MLKPRRNSTTTEFTVNKIYPHSFSNLFKSDEVSGTDKESIITSIKEVDGPKDINKQIIKPKFNFGALRAQSPTTNLKIIETDESSSETGMKEDEALSGDSQYSKTILKKATKQVNFGISNVELGEGSKPSAAKKRIGFKRCETVF